MVVALGEQYHVGEKPTEIQYIYIDRHAGTPNKTKTKDAMSLDYSSVCNIGSRVVRVSIFAYEVEQFWLPNTHSYHFVWAEKRRPLANEIAFFSATIFSRDLFAWD